MIELSKRIKIIVDDKARYTDWSTREDIKANLQVDLILLLDEFDYPPVTLDDVYKEVLEQAENFKKFADVSQQLEARHNSWSVKQEAEQARLANERRAAQNKRMQDYGRAFGEGFYSQRPKELHGKAKRIQAREDERNTRRDIKKSRKNNR